ncbi:MAG: LytTR family DNA-binding domain-containing protein [Mobilitalea sp.]
MNIITKQVKDKPLTITVEYPEFDNKIQTIINKINSLDLKINCNGNGILFSISITNIYYIESVERKTFIYTKNEIYISDKKLYELEQFLTGTSIVRVGKSCLMNMDMLYSIKQLLNSQLEATLSNGEKLIVARTYIKSIKKKLMEEVQ